MNESELERLVVRLVGDSTSYQRMTSDAKKATQDLGDALGDQTGRMAVMSQRVNAFGLQLRGYGLQMAAIGASVVGFGSAVASVFRGVRLAADAEMLKSNFEVMLGSAEQAEKMVKDIQQFAATTPLNTGDLQRFAKMLLQAGVAADDLLPTIRMLGDAALGDAQKIQGLAYAFGQVKTFGRLMGGELIQLRNAGFDPLAEIARTTGRSMAELRQAMERGEISFDMVRKSFQTATTAGGRFAGGMEKASTTVSGLFSTMQDDIDAALRTIGQDVVELFSLKQVMKEVSAAVQAVTEAFKSISPETKKMLVGLVAGGAAATALVAGLVALKVGIGAVVGIFAMLGPFGIAMVATFAVVSAGIAVLVNHLGGIGPALEFIKKQALAAWEWLEPVRAAVSSLAETITGLLSRAWESVKAAAVSAWESVVGDVDVNWDRVREVATRAIYLIEFSLLNLGKVANVVWLRMQYDAVRVFNNLEHFFTTVLPEAAKFARGQFVAINLDMWARFKAANAKAAELFIQANVDMFSGAKQLVIDFVKFQVNAMRKIPEFISGAADMAKELLPGNVADAILNQFKGAAQAAVVEAEKTGEAMAEATAQGFKIPQREEGQLERDLREEWQQALGGVQQDFEQFVLNRRVRDAFRKAFSPQAPEENPAARSMDETADAAKKAAKEVQKLDAALVGSAEAERRLAAHIRGAVGGQFGTPNQTPVQIASARAESLLADIREATRALGRTAFFIAEANF